MTKRIARIGGRRVGPTKLPSYTVATLPNPIGKAGVQVYVSDGTSNKRMAVSDGAAWRFPDGLAVS